MTVLSAGTRLCTWEKVLICTAKISLGMYGKDIKRVGLHLGEAYRVGEDIYEFPQK